MYRPTSPRDGRWRFGPVLRQHRRRARRPAKRCRAGILATWAVPPFSLGSIVIGPAASSMRKRVEFPVGLDLPPAVREPVRLEHQKGYDDQPDCDLAQEGDVVV